jgi:hypothetical protein
LCSRNVITNLSIAFSFGLARTYLEAGYWQDPEPARLERIRVRTEILYRESLKLRDGQEMYDRVSLGLLGSVVVMVAVPPKSQLVGRGFFW